MVDFKKKRKNFYFQLIGVCILALILIGALYILAGNFIGNVILDPNSIGFNGENRAANYEELVNNIFNNSNITSLINETILWVPWFTTSSQCNEESLHKDSSCNIGLVNFTQNCMVTDELSQVGILASLSSNQTHMDRFYNVLSKIRSSNGVLPSWRSYRNGSAIIPCGEGVNDNCDTASDADARIIISLLTASNNSLFTDENQKQAYYSLAVSYAEDFVNYELVNECHPSGTIYGDICYWLASGSASKTSGLSSNNFAYTGYYPDAIIAMLQACAQTENITYCNIANNITLNYLLASSFNGSSFGVPPGRSFKWVNLSEIPSAECTNTCDPIQWDDSDAPRALGLCQAPYYASLLNTTLSGLNEYCSLWRSTYLDDPESVPYQYLADGTIAHSPQSGYFAQGLQSLAQFATDSYVTIIDNALSHYNPQTKTWDNGNCSGVYTTAIAIRSLGAGIGRDSKSFETGLFSVPNSSEINQSQEDLVIPSSESSGSSGGGGGGSSSNSIPISNNNESDENKNSSSSINYLGNESTLTNNSKENLELEEKMVSSGISYLWIIGLVTIIFIIFIIISVVRLRKNYASISEKPETIQHN